MVASVLTARRSSVRDRPDAPPRRSKPGARLALAALLVALLCFSLADTAPGVEHRGLVLQDIEILGNTRTSDAVVRRQLGLRAEQPIDGEALLAAVEDLRRRELFDRVDFHTRPGSRRGAVILVVDVRERGPDVRLGTGLTDLDGWYLIPVELSLNNALGRAEKTALQWRIGYRHAGLIARYREGDAPDDRWHWGVDAALVATDRIYYDQRNETGRGIEVAHKIRRNSLGVSLGHRLGAGWDLSAGLLLEGVEADSTARIWMDDKIAGVARSDRIAFDDLPAGVAAGVGRRDRTILRSELALDTRRGMRAGTAAQGVWGRIRFQRTFERDGGGFNTAALDLRNYLPVPGGIVAGRLSCSVTGAAAPFYDRLYTGGLYSVRGVPSQSLSAPEGGMWSWVATLEYRAALVGQVEDPRLAGALFVDAGRGGGPDAGFAIRHAATSVGWGLRWRILRGVRVGIDTAMPLQSGPVDDAFRVHAALGWSF